MVPKGYTRVGRQTWVVLVGGFLQQMDGNHGLAALFHLLDRFKRPGLNLLLREWTTDTAAIARRVALLADGGAPTVVVVGFSYGGTTAVRLCEELEERGVTVGSLTLIDAVWRPWRGFPSVLSVLPWWRLRVPRNVKRVRVYRQREDRPMGHEVVLAEPYSAEMVGPVFLPLRHVEMDDAVGIHQAVLDDVIEAIG